MAAAIKVLVMGGHTQGFHQFEIMGPIYRKFLSEAGTHEFIVTANHYTAMFQMFSRPFGNTFHIHLVGDVCAAMTDIYTDFFAHSFSPISIHVARNSA